LFLTKSWPTSFKEFFEGKAGTTKQTMIASSANIAARTMKRMYDEEKPNDKCKIKDKSDVFKQELFLLLAHISQSLLVGSTGVTTIWTNNKFQENPAGITQPVCRKFEAELGLGSRKKKSV